MLLTVLVVGVKATEFVKVPPEVSDTSYPVGAVTVRSETRFAPETEKLCSAETNPLHEVKALSVPVLDIEGSGSLSTIVIVELGSKIEAFVGSAN